MNGSMDRVGGENSGAKEDRDEATGLRLSFARVDILLLLEGFAEGVALPFSAVSLLPDEETSSWVVTVEESEAVYVLVWLGTGGSDWM